MNTKNCCYRLCVEEGLKEGRGLRHHENAWPLQRTLAARPQEAIAVLAELFTSQRTLAYMDKLVAHSSQPAKRSTGVVWLWSQGTNSHRDSHPVVLCEPASASFGRVLRNLDGRARH